MLAREVLAGRGSDVLVIRSQVLAEFSVAVTRKLARPVDPDRARRAVDALSDLPVISSDAALVQAAMATSQRHQLALWDAMIIEAATIAGGERLLSEDLNAGVVLRGVRIENPFSEAASEQP